MFQQRFIQIRSKFPFIIIALGSNLSFLYTFGPESGTDTCCFLPLTRDNSPNLFHIDMDYLPERSYFFLQIFFLFSIIYIFNIFTFNCLTVLLCIQKCMTPLNSLFCFLTLPIFRVSGRQVNQTLALSSAFQVLYQR